MKPKTQPLPRSGAKFIAEELRQNPTPERRALAMLVESHDVTSQTLENHSLTLEDYGNRIKNVEEQLPSVVFTNYGKKFFAYVLVPVLVIVLSAAATIYLGLK